MECNYYVYEWFFIDSGKVFYVGKGKGRRYREKKDRNDKFIKYVNKLPCSVRKVAEGLTEEKAYEKEIELIDFYKRSGQCDCNFTCGGDAPPIHIGADAPNRKRVVQLTLDGQYVKTWDYITEIEKVLGFQNSAIVGCCKGKKGRKSVGGFLWVYEDEYDQGRTFTYNRNTNAKKILQYRLDGTFVREWDSAKQISEELGFRRSGLSLCLKGKQKTCEGFIWMFKKGNNIPKNIEGKTESRVPTPIVQLSLDGDFIARHKDCADAARNLGKNHNSSIVKCCQKERKTAYKFKWMFEYEYEQTKNRI
ncbi:hypothetical protein ACPV3A_16400 [Paenibacillus sp. Dod16]|uniref:hypothetical protein n=1 Tax=Paenibacillus sp. Dod16 TaxID=3416392 RepID=UPI003CF64B6F